MAAPFRTFLDLCNTLIREINEVELTSLNFNNAVGIQNLLKIQLTEVTLIFVMQKTNGVFLQ